MILSTYRPATGISKTAFFDMFCYLIKKCSVDKAKEKKQRKRKKKRLFSGG